MIGDAREANLLEQFHRAIALFSCDLVVQRERPEESRLDDFNCRQFRIDIVRPRRLNEADRLSQRRQIRFTKTSTKDRALTRRRPKMSRDNARQRALAATVGTEDRRARA